MSDVSHLLSDVHSLLLAQEIESARAKFRTLPFASINDEKDIGIFGTLAIQLQFLRAAVQIFERALQLYPKNAQFYNNLATALLMEEKPKLAKPHLLKALELKPEYDLALLNLGSCEEQLGELHKSCENFLKALAVNPHLSLAHIRLAVVAERMNDVESLKIHAETAFEQNQNHPDVFYVLCFLHRRQKDFTQALTDIDQALLLSCGNPTYLFLKARVLEDLQRFSEAQTLYQQANQLIRPQKDVRSIVLNDHRESLNFMEHRSRQAVLPIAQSGPLYILSSPRSGTSLLSEMLAQHSHFQNYGELDLNEKIYMQALQSYGCDDQMHKLMSKLDEDQGSVLNHLQHLDDQLWQEMSPETGKYWIDKGIMNAYFLPLMAKLHPQAPFVHIIRDGREVALSIFRTQFREFYWFQHDPMDALTHWRLTIEMVRTSARSYGLNLIELKYEDLVMQPERELRDILGWLGLDWESSMLNFHQSKNQTHTASYAQVKTPLYRSASDFAKRHYCDLYQRLTAKEGEFLQSLGYT